MKMLSSRYAEITLAFIDIGKTCHSREFLTSQILLNTFRKNKNSHKIFQIYSSLKCVEVDHA